MRHYHTTDTLKEVANVGLLPPSSVLDYVSCHPPPGFPLHKLEIKIGGIYQLLQNMSLDEGLVKNIHFVIVAIGNRLITVHLLQGLSGSSTISTQSEDILIPQITFTTLLSTYIDTKTVSTCTCLGSYFQLMPGTHPGFCGVNLTCPVFSHGQLYTALSQICHQSHVKVLL